MRLLTPALLCLALLGFRVEHARPDVFGNSAGATLARPDHAARDALLDRLDDPGLLALCRVNPIRGDLEYEARIEALRPYRYDPVVIQTLLWVSDFAAVEWEDEAKTRPRLLYWGLEDRLSQPRPARKILIEMGPAAVPALLDHYLGRCRELAAGAEVAPLGAVGEDFDTLAVYKILGERVDTGRAAITQLRRRVADQPQDKLVRAACHDLVNKLRRGAISTIDEWDEVRAWLDANKP